MKTTMKKKYLLFAAAALTLAACSNDDENLNGGPVELRLSSSLEVQTRAGNDIQGAQFDADEDIDVFIHEDVAAGETATSQYDQPLLYTTMDANGNMSTNNQQYFPSSGKGVNIYAYYPSKAVSSIAEGATEDFTIQSDQSTDENYKLSDLMWGAANNPVERTRDAVPLTFSHLLTKVTVNLKQGNGQPDLEGAVVKLKGVLPTTTLTTSTGNISEAKGTATDITVMKASANDDWGSAVIIPQTLSGEFFEVTLKDGGVLRAKINFQETITFMSRKEYKYEITVNLTTLAVFSSAINDWTTESTGSGFADMQ